ncbi:MAG: ABC transporter substrate-binding protein, partial [Lachnospiraceae bacterium]|nr:ABC transporter substrate-binding protein [Lachnospiraceae bacterium]
MKKKRIVSMLLAASMAMSLVGCGGSASTAPAGDTAATGTEGGSTEAAPAGGENTIEFWSVFT